MQPYLRCIALGLAMIGASAGEARTDEVIAGVATAVTTTAMGTPPTRPARVLQLGSDVVRYERLQTDAGGRLHLLFQDQTALTVGPHSEVVLDSFVYDPQEGSGEIVLGAAQGVMRFVGGRLGRQGALSIVTPVTVVGIRGSSAILLVDPSGATEIIHVTGETTVRARGRPDLVQRLTRSGFAVYVAGPDAAPTAPYRVDPGVLAGTIRQLEAVDDAASGGIEEAALPTVQIARVNSDLPPERQPNTLPARPPEIDPIPELPDQPEIVAEQDRRESSVAEQLSAAPSEPTPPSPPAPEPLPPTPDRGFTLSSGRWSATDVATPGQGWLGSGNPTYDRPFVGATGQNGWLTIPLDGGDTVFVPARRGERVDIGTDAAATQSPFGPVSGSTYVNAAGTAGYAQLREVAFAGDGQIVFGGTPVGGDVELSTFAAYDLRNDHILENQLPFTYRAPGAPAFVAAAVSPLYRTPATETVPARLAIGALAIDGTGSDQRVAISGGTFAITGDPLAVVGNYRYFAFAGADPATVRSAGGMSSIPDGAGNHLFGGSQVDVFVLDGVDYVSGAPDFAAPMTESRTGSADVVFNVAQPANLTALPAGAGDARSTRTLEGYAAAIAQPAGGTPFALATDGLGVTVTTRAQTSDLDASFALAGTGGAYVFGFGDSAPAGTRSTFVDDARWVALDSGGGADDAIAFTHAMAPLATLPGGVAACACEFLQWGWWGASRDAGDLVVPLGTFVVGELPDLAQMPLTGTATYTGQAIAHIVNDGARYVATGTFRNAFDFAQREGTVTVDNLDGRFFSGAVQTTEANRRDYATTAAIVADGVGMNLRGSFFAGGGDPVAATGGQFTLDGANYQGAGTFAATK